MDNKKTMDTALVKRLPLLIIESRKKDFDQARLKDPNSTFCDTFQVFLEQCSVSIETERQANKDNMCEDCTLADKFKVLTAHIDRRYTTSS